MLYCLNCLTLPSYCLMRLRREGRVEEALEYAQGDLARLRGVLSYASRTYDAMLQDVVALLAYERPQARTLPC